MRRTAHRHAPAGKNGWDSLTDSRLTVVHLIVEGRRSCSVAVQLHLSRRTVKTHLRSAFAKLGITSWAQADALMRPSD
jgi:DNA-binding CsgD family transcriptional regulator